MSNASGSYFPFDPNYASSLSKIPPPPPLKPPVLAQTLAQTPARPKNTLERDSSEDILVAGSQGFARPLSNSKFLIPFPGTYQIDRTLVHRLQIPAASTHCDQIVRSQLHRVL